jgi:hypothetical protein
MGPLVYGLCALTSLLCFAMLLRSYLQKRVRLLLWSSLCFFFLALQNSMVFIDLVLVPQTSLIFWRTLPGFLGPLILLIALIWENK